MARLARTFRGECDNGYDQRLQEDKDMRYQDRRFLHQSALALALAGAAVPASAAFFQLLENNASGLGNAFAGGAAIAEDASTVWYNPAGMTRLKGQQLVVAGHFIDPRFKASVNSASAAAILGGSNISGGGSDAGESAFVPNLYYTRPITSDFSIGAGINAPFGLATEYDSTWAGRYYALRSEIKTVNINFAGAYKLNDVVSVGAGINYQKLDAELTQAIDFATICNAAGQAATCGSAAGFNPNTNPLDGKARVVADGTAWGYNLGLLTQLENDMRIGIAFRSKIEHSLSGTIGVTRPITGSGIVNGTVAAVADGLSLVNSGAEADVILPATLSISAYTPLGSRWAVMADVTRTYWSALPELRIQFDSNQADSVVTLNLKDVYRYSVGATHKTSGAWMFRGGIALDQSPVASESDGTPRLPDGDRTWFSAGASLQVSPTLSFDFGYVYIKVDDPKIRKTTGAPGSENFVRGNLSVDYTGSVQVLSAQARWMF